MMSDETSKNEETGRTMPEKAPLQETARQRLCRDLKERVARGEYWVDLDFLSCLLVDSGATRCAADAPNDTRL